MWNSRALAAGGILFVFGAAALGARAHGSDGQSALCREAAPWILDESAEANPRADVDNLNAATDSAPALDVVTYNLHSGLGTRHAFLRRRALVERDLRSIARSIAAAGRDGRGPDVVALNEVDFASRRSAWIDQARFVAGELERITGTAYQVFRGETWRRDVPGLEVRFGNAALVRLPVLRAQACLFDDLDHCDLYGSATPIARQRSGLLRRMLAEPRGVIRVTVELQGRIADVLVTHLDAFDTRQREAQAATLISRFVAPGRTTVLLGDMNAVPTALTRGRWMFSDDRTHAILAMGDLADASISLASRHGQRSLGAWATYPAGAPVWGLDWVLGSLDLGAEEVAAIGDTASDHRGLHVRYRLLRDGTETEASRTRYGRVCERLRAFDSACGFAGS
jgi:endonuclease/exonuclease/phosphatase family metal-dependent hydrolase